MKAGETQEISPHQGRGDIFWLMGAPSLFHHKAEGKKGQLGIWRVTRSTRLQNLALRTVLFPMAHLVVASLWAYFTEKTWILSASTPELNVSCRPCAQA
eukprot:1150051-Pelagomonas_calceolata.AAC.8